MPRTLTSPYSEYAGWVDARAIAVRDGKASAPGIHPSAKKRIEWLLSEDPVGGCVRAPQDQVNRVGAQPRGNLDEAVRSADFILFGHVTGRSYGFSGIHAGQLLRISVDRVFKGGGTSRFYYAFAPIGEFDVAGRHICAANGDYAPPPNIGAEIFVFTYPPDGELLSIADPGDLVPVGPNGDLVLPRQYSTKRPADARVAPPSLTKDDLIRQIAGRTGEAGK